MSENEDRREADELRRDAYKAWKVSGPALDDLTLRAAAQHALAIGDLSTERQIDGILDAR